MKKGIPLGKILLPSLDPELAALIGERAEDGSSITCIACSKFDHNKYRGTVKCSRGRLYTYQSFVNDHVKNMYHSHSVKRMRDDKIQADQYFHIHGKPRPEPKRKNQSSMVSCDNTRNLRMRSK